MANTVLCGPYAGHRIRTARKAGRCQYWRGAEAGGECGKTIAVGDRYVAGDQDVFAAGGFGRQRYCLDCVPEACKATGEPNNG